MLPVVKRPDGISLEMQAFIDRVIVPALVDAFADEMSAAPGLPTATPSARAKPGTKQRGHYAKPAPKGTYADESAPVASRKRKAAKKR